MCVEQPANWVWASPQRISLDPGASATVSIVFSPNRETMIASGTHQAAIRLRDLEGVIFAECARNFEVEERQELAMTVSLRGPLMSFGMAEGFVLHCNLVNRGNVDVTVTPIGEPHPSLAFSNRKVQVPFQGEVSFDIEVRWNASRRSNHPDVVTLKAPYRGGEAVASIEWRYIADALDPFMPIYSTTEEDDLLSLSWLPQPEARTIPTGELEFFGDASLDSPESQVGMQSGNGVPATTSAAQENQAFTPPAHVPRRREVQYTYGRRLNPWWPLVQNVGGRWRVKPMPILLFVIAVEGMVIGVQQAQTAAFESPALRARIAPIARAIRFVPNTAAAIAGFGRHAITSIGNHLHYRAHQATIPRPAATATHAPRALARVTAAPSKVARAPGSALRVAKPELYGLTARYVKPGSVVISFTRRDVYDVQLTVVQGTNTLYRADGLSGHTAAVKVRHWKMPLVISVVGSAPGGEVLQRHIVMPRPAGAPK